MASKVPKFGAWEGGENYTVFFDNARKKKTNGQMINPNDPQDMADMFPQIGGPPPQAPKAEPKGQQSKTPEFGAWDNGENVGYTEYFESKRKTKNGEPTASTNEPQLNRDMHPRKDPPSKPEAARAKVPPFGGWENGGEGGYTQSFENVRKNNNKNGRTVTPEPSSDAPQLNRDVGEPAPAKEGRAKVPEFGGWNEGENGAYTAYFENARKNKNAGPVPDPAEVNNRARPSTGAGTKNKADDPQLRNNTSRGSNYSVATSEAPSRNGKQNTGGQSPIQQKAGRLQQKPPASRGSQTPERGTAIPAWGVWNTDPQQAEGFTGAFTRAKEERNTPLNSNAPQRYQQQHQRSQEEKKGCCFGWF
ncbi:RPM1-interacting protein 4 isoform X2 [Spinacia oleracea]|uniref:RPM1-interacting protein 4 isoform X2 n=1 Tax=Spinacia oleracea TaxID=3562 RepID=A0A9R0KAQ6_SPIOL|nr:RPM1-interacting protein 4-like isoform X2 [Spinacia oleracea]